MVLATYQPADWKTWENDRYSRLKEVLGIPQEKNIYWCFPANTPEQALINSCCTEPNQPSVLVLFNTDTYWKVDKIKWNRYVETKDESLLTEELLEVAHSETAEYIVTDIPEDYFDFSLTDITNSNEELLKCFAMSVGFETAEKIIGSYLNVYNQIKESGFVKIDEDFSEEQKETIATLFCLKKAFENIMLTTLMTASSQTMKSAVAEEIAGKKFTIFAPPIKKHLDLTNEYVNYCKNLPEMTDENAYEKLKDIQQEIFDLYFGHNYVKKIKGTVHPKMLCPCGSGKPYKKCCAKKNDKPDISDVMAKGID